MCAVTTPTFKVCSLAVTSMEGMALYQAALKFLFTARFMLKGSIMEEHLLPARDRSQDEDLWSGENNQYSTPAADCLQQSWNEP